MTLTFGQYSTLSATRHCITQDQLTSQTEFDRLMISYYITVLLGNGLIMAKQGHNSTCYKLTEAGEICLDEYERFNPELTIRRILHKEQSTW